MMMPGENEGATAICIGGTEPALLDQTIAQALSNAARQWPDVEAVVVPHQGTRLTYAQLDQRVDLLGRGFLSLGLQPGERIAIWAPNCVEWLLTQLAAASVGLVLVNLNPAYRAAEAAFALRKTQTKALVAASRFKSSDYLAMIDAIGARAAGGDGEACPDLAYLIKLDGGARPGWIEFADVEAAGSIVAQNEIANIREALHPDDAVNIQFTSGTTGTPKGATLSHRNILNNGFFVGNAIRLVAGDRLCLPVPLYHCFGMVMGNLACLAHGVTMVYPSPSFDPLATLRAVQAERCSALYGVPTMFIAMLQHPDFSTFDLTTLRTGIMAGSPCPIEIMREVVDRMDMSEVIIAYGMTETSPVSFAGATDDPLWRRVETVGRIMPHLAAKIVDEFGATVPVGQPGEVCVRGYSVMLGYWGDPEATDAVLDDDGWMHTGDIGRIDTAGYCRIVGRLKDMIIRGGENVYPREIEEFLYQHPAVEDVAVVGIPDQRMGEEICAWIKVRSSSQLTAQEVRDFCADRIAHYKIPKVIRFVDEFPMTITGKVQKYEIRRVMEAEFNAAIE